MVSALVASPPTQPARGGGQAARCGGQAIRGGDQTVRGGGQPARSRPRGGGQGGMSQPYFYTSPARPEAGSSNVVITGIVLVFHRDTLVLFDPSSTYSYVSSYFALYLVVPRDSFSAHVYMSMFVGDCIIIDRVYSSCVVTIGSLETSVDILLLNMIDIDVILGMD
ncbi:uncharacterized protein [Nicotiana tomentosiformis]|uniref:uncharacterized protein n=1 Tax=Nicotiana tomentosiformis TaxID=4098 RepID=UPI00388C5047